MALEGTDGVLGGLIVATADCKLAEVAVIEGELGEHMLESHDGKALTSDGEDCAVGGAWEDRDCARWRIACERASVGGIKQLPRFLICRSRYGETLDRLKILQGFSCVRFKNSIHGRAGDVDTSIPLTST